MARHCRAHRIQLFYIVAADKLRPKHFSAPRRSARQGSVEGRSRRNGPPASRCWDFELARDQEVGGEALVQVVWQVQTRSLPPLPRVPFLHLEDGSPLPMDLQLCWLLQLQVLLFGTCLFSIVLPHDSAHDGGVCPAGCG